MWQYKTFHIVKPPVELNALHKALDFELESMVYLGWEPLSMVYMADVNIYIVMARRTKERA